MPTYSYVREDTGEPIDIFMTMAGMENAQEKDDEGSYVWVYRDSGKLWWNGEGEMKCNNPELLCVKARRTYLTGDTFPSNYPMASESMGCHPKQIPEFVEHARKAGVPTEFTKDGRPVLTDKHHRKKYAESRGFYDRNGSYGDPQHSGE